MSDSQLKNSAYSRFMGMLTKKARKLKDNEAIFELHLATSKFVLHRHGVMTVAGTEALGPDLEQLLKKHGAVFAVEPMDVRFKEESKHD